MRREAKFTVLFRHWLRANPMATSAFELKQTQGNTIPFSCVQEHQIDALLAVKTKHGILYKAPDDSRGAKPFDMFYLRQAYAFVVIKFPGGFELIDIENFLLEKKRSKKKSLTYSRAKEISWMSVKTRK